MKRPSDEDGRFILSADGQTVEIGGKSPAQDAEDPTQPRNPWLFSLAIWTVVAMVAWIWVQSDAGECARRVAERCARTACGPDEGWSCGLGGLNLLMLWVAVLVLGAITAASAWLLRAVSVRRADGAEPPGR
jgi:hypothetical protein